MHIVVVVFPKKSHVYGIVKATTLELALHSACLEMLPRQKSGGKGKGGGAKVCSSHVPFDCEKVVARADAFASVSQVQAADRLKAELISNLIQTPDLVFPGSVLSCIDNVVGSLMACK